MDYDILEIFIIALGFAITYFLLNRINPESYQVEPFMGMVASGLYDLNTVGQLAPAVPLLYLQHKRKGVKGEKYLNVLVPLPAESVLHVRTERWTTVNGERTMQLQYDMQTNSNSPNVSSTLFHETLILVEGDVRRIEVRCAVANGPSGGSGVGDGDSDTEDPIGGGPATPYMSGDVTRPCSMAYNGSDLKAMATVECQGNVTTDTRLDRGTLQALQQPPGSSVVSVSVGDRRIANVFMVV